MDDFGLGDLGMASLCRACCGFTYTGSQLAVCVQRTIDWTDGRRNALHGGGDGDEDDGDVDDDGDDDDDAFAYLLLLLCTREVSVHGT